MAKRNLSGCNCLQVFTNGNKQLSLSKCIKLKFHSKKTYIYNPTITIQMPHQRYFLYINTPLGIVEMESDAVFIRSVKFVDEPTENSSSQPEILKACCKQLHEYFSGKRKEFTVPVQQDGTVFQ